MRVLLVSPSIPPEATGNAATAGRLAASLARLGVQVFMVKAGDLDGAAGLGRCLVARPADLVHVHHLVKSGRLLLPVPPGGWPPIVASAGGTDLWPMPTSQLDVLFQVAELARRILVPTQEGQSFLGKASDHKDRLRLVPRGVSLGTAPFDLRAAAGAGLGDVLFFLPAGFRAVKGNARAVAPLASLRKAGLPVRLAAAGPVLEPEQAAAFDRLARPHPWIRRLPPVPTEAMGPAMAGADVVLNTSHHEGMSNAVLEAMLAGRAVLASDIPGNRAVIRDGETGLLFRDEAESEVKAERLARDPALRERLGRSARDEARARFSAEAEAQAVLAAYCEALGMV